MAADKGASKSGRGGSSSVNNAEISRIKWDAKKKINDRTWQGKEKINDRTWQGKENVARLSRNKYITNHTIIDNSADRAKRETDKDIRDMITLGVLTYKDGKLCTGSNSHQSYMKNSAGYYTKYDDYVFDMENEKIDKLREERKEKFGKLADEEIRRFENDHAIVLSDRQRSKKRSRLINKMIKKDVKKRYKDTEKAFKLDRKLRNRWSKDYSK